MLEALSSLSRLAQQTPTAPAFTCENRTLNYAQLAGRIAALGDELKASGGEVFGILAANGLEWVIADLALAHAGKTMVPLPAFFSAEQLAHIVQDANVTHVLISKETQPLAQGLGLSPILISVDGSLSPFTADQDSSAHASRIIYTSGTTGAPKGVRLGARQIDASSTGLLRASQANAKDRHLSVLPFSLLLEQIAGIYVPLLAGAPVCIAPNVMAPALYGDPLPLIKALMSARATTSVLVPGLLQALVEGLAATANAAPSDLRFVAVGGAPVNAALAERAWALGLPIYEGYGLSECCSVVSVNTPDNRTPDTVGHPIPGVDVSIEDGEIVVRSNTVMDGYLRADGAKLDAPEGVWRTGDLGVFSEDGALRILGRKDNLIITPAGRNISPEWVEGVCEREPLVAKAVLSQVDGQTLVLLIAPAQSTVADELQDRLAQVFATLPDYARPHHVAVTPLTEMLQQHLISPLGDVRRKACTAHAGAWLNQQHAA